MYNKCGEGGVSMQVNSLVNSKTDFGHKRKDNISEAVAFVNMDNAQLRNLAYNISYDKEDQRKTQNRLLAAFLAMPVIDIVSRGILAKKEYKTPQNELIRVGNKLSTKARAVGKTAAGWTGCLALLGAYGLIKDGINSHSDSMKDFNQEHPILSFVVDLGVLMAGLAIGKKGFDKLKSKFPETVAKLKKDTHKFFAKLDNTKISKEKMPKMAQRTADFRENHPELSKFGRAFLENSVLVGLGVGVLGSIGVANKEQKRIEKNYKKLKKIQAQTAKQLVNVLEEERTILVQNQKPAEKQVSKSHHPEPEPDEENL